MSISDFEDRRKLSRRQALLFPFMAGMGAALTGVGRAADSTKTAAHQGLETAPHRARQLRTQNMARFAGFWTAAFSPSREYHMARIQAARIAGSRPNLQSHGKASIPL
jgi:hypothetical protein